MFDTVPLTVSYMRFYYLPFSQISHTKVGAHFVVVSHFSVVYYMTTHTVCALVRTI
jgi:hypothetical protein